MENSTKFLSTQSWLSCRIQKLVFGGVKSIYIIGVALTHNIIMIVQKLKSGKLVSLYDNVPFIFECFMANKIPNGTERHCESTESESHQVAKIFSFFFSRVVSNCMILSQWFLQKQQHFMLSSVLVYHFSQLQGLTRHLKSTIQELWLHLQCHFLPLCTYTETT